MSGKGYLVTPDAGTGRGVLVLHSWWGLDDATRAICDSLADAGYLALAPDLVGMNRTTTDPAEAQAWLAESDPNEVADMVLSSTAILRSANETPDAPIGVLGMAMGASWALWLASRSPEMIGAVSFFYGSQDVDHLDVTAAVQGHFAEHDEFVSDDERVLLQAALLLDGTDAEFFEYPTCHHGFFEERATYDEPAATEAWTRVLAFFDSRLGR